MLKPNLWFFLFHIAKLGATNRVIRTSSLELAKKTGTSQQTASRLLIELSKRGLVERRIVPRGCELKLTSKGVEELRRLYSETRVILEPKEEFLVIEGELFEGLEEGRWYVSQLGYRKQFIERLGFDPYPGTLNLRLDPLNQSLRTKLESYPPIRIRGFSTKDRSFGSVNCYRAIVNDKVEGAVIITERGHYGPSVLEVIAPVLLKKRLGLKVGSKVRVKVLY